ncbi:hypothetical protein DMA15_18205 [Streptomyces sp. WAC 01529]|uniref:hypothetical protein n=1 Tax=Streptomyces sp. WAC 01529 TaxID=2203205 RepID=UPI000F70985F|nr:hypothetical protein [Streptomyces sp. WAC 01529]AZM54254.1 hypothetical protein DMA15_18205 [Streptomyces sp. WAC 01529]
MQPRLIVLLGVVAATVVLPLAGASAGPVGDGDAKSPPPAPSAAPPNTSSGSGSGPDSRADAGTNAATDAAADTSRCGPELSSPEGIEAQTCVLTQGRETWARTYYRNATGEDLTGVLTQMGPDARTVQMHCAVDAGDEPGVCETPRERSAGEAAAYSAVAEFAARESGGLLLRSGSNSAPAQGS